MPPPEPGGGWPLLLRDLAELERAGALGGIRAIAAEQLARIRAGTPCERPVDYALTEIAWMDTASAPGSPRRVQMLATAAAMLATEIDRIGRQSAAGT